MPHPHSSAPLGVEKKVAKRPLKAVKDKILRAKARALDEKEAVKASHAERKAQFDARQQPVVKKHFQSIAKPDSGSKATRERVGGSCKADARLMKADGHGLRHEGLQGDDGWATKKGKGKGI